jgi:hypothetical protein
MRIAEMVADEISAGPMGIAEMVADEISARKKIAVDNGFCASIPTDPEKLRSLQEELRSGLTAGCPLETLREWLTVSLILGEVLVASNFGNLVIPWLSEDIKLKLLPEKDLLYMASYRWDEPEKKWGWTSGRTPYRMQ